MRRRTVMMAVGGIFTGAGALVGTGAFSTVEAERTVTVETTSDASAFLQFLPTDHPSLSSSDTPDQHLNGAYAQITDGTLQINLDGSHSNSAGGLNQKAITVVDRVVYVTNNGTQDVTALTFTIDVTGTTDDSAHEKALAITTDGAVVNDGSNNGEDLLGPSGAADVTDDLLGVGETVPFGFEIDLIDHGVDGTFESSAEVTLTITAETGATGGGGGGGSTPAGTAVYDWDDLYDVRNDLGGDYYLADDLDANSGAHGSRVANPSEGWDPIGGDGSHFAGTFDGNGHTIQDLVIDRPGEQGVGLFGSSSGTLENVRIEGADVTGGNNTGVLLGFNIEDGTDTGTVKQSYVTGTVSGSSVTGGLVGGLNPNTTVEDSYSATTVSSDGEYVGGLAGTSEGTIRNSYATGDVSSSGSGFDDDGVAGLVGLNTTSATITRTYATGNVDAPDIDKGAGRLVGMNKASAEKSYADGDSTITGPDKGIVGRTLSNFGGTTGPDVVTLTTSEMQGSSAQTNMDELFTNSNTWETVEAGESDTSGDGYPILQAIGRQIQLEEQGVDS